MMISLDDITLRVREQLSFNHTTWQIGPDQHWAIIGPTGSGKSTLAKGLCRQLPLVQGQILFFFDGPDRAGRPYLEANEVLTFSIETHQAFTRRFASYHQARWQSFEGEEAPPVHSLLEEHAAPDKQANVIDLLGIRPLLARKVHQLSHGESRKVFLAWLLLRSPRLLILDDPFIGLDVQSRARLKDGIERLLNNHDPQIVFLSARFDEIPAAINHLLLVREHSVLVQGDRRTLQANPEYRSFFSIPSGGSHESSVPAAFSRMVGQYTDVMSQDEENPEMIAMRKVTIAYQDVPVLKEIDWTVQRGERWALLGPNGAGKTTLLSLIMADNPQAYTNDIRLFGRQRGSGESIWEIKRRIGWVSPELHLFYDRSTTARDVVSSGFFDSVGLYRRCTPEQETVITGWMEALELTPLVDQPLHALSTGQQRLVLLARALVKHPPLLVLDEPCQGLDDAHRFRFLKLLDRLCSAAPVTMIYVSHYQDEIPASTTHLIQLDHGQILRCDPVNKKP
jgi:molybdate transport system ATP-binding protein